MGGEQRNIDILLHIVRYCNEIEHTIEYFGRSFETFEESFIFRNACTMCILQIGELTSCLSEDFRKTYSELPWNKIKGMRNVVAHDYESLDLKLSWGTLNRRVPELKTYCEAIIDQYWILDQEAKNPEEDEDFEL